MSYLAPMHYPALHWSERVRVAPAIELSDDERAELTKLSRSGRTSVRLAQRASIVLLAAKGMQNKDIAEQLGVGRVQVARWRERYLQGGIEGIERDMPRGAPPVKVDVQRLVELTTQSKPAATTHWSTRRMAAELGVAASTVWRHWQDHGLKPHVVRGFKISRDPKFVEKLEDIVGLYMAPPEHALVLCCDEKSQVQALDRTQPGLPIKKGRAQTMTHDRFRVSRCTFRCFSSTCLCESPVQQPRGDRAGRYLRARCREQSLQSSCLPALNQNTSLSPTA